jgi:tryptophan-rich sensory protein
MRKYFILIACIALTLGLGIASGISTAGEIKSWYIHLNKPFFNPPNYLFGPVWTALYTLMGVALYRIIQLQKSVTRTRCLIIFTIQFLLNLSWSSVFFGLHALLAALFIIIAMWISILMMILYFKKLDRTAAYINIPYLAWVSFATLLNAAIWWLN